MWRDAVLYMARPAAGLERAVHDGDGDGDALHWPRLTRFRRRWCRCPLNRNKNGSNLGFPSESRHAPQQHQCPRPASRGADPPQAGRRAALRAADRFRAGRRPADRDRRTVGGAAGGRAQPGAARRHRHRQDLHHGASDRGDPAPGDHPRPEQDPRRAALRRVQGLLPRERGRIFRQLLRLLPARGLRRAHRHLHREGIARSTSRSTGCATRRPGRCWNATT